MAFLVFNRLEIPTGWGQDTGWLNDRQGGFLVPRFKPNLTVPRTHQRTHSLRALPSLLDLFLDLFFNDAQIKTHFLRDTLWFLFRFILREPSPSSPQTQTSNQAARMRRSSVNGVAALKKNLQPMMAARSITWGETLVDENVGDTSMVFRWVWCQAEVHTLTRPTDGCLDQDQPMWSCLGLGHLLAGSVRSHFGCCVTSSEVM